MKKTLPLIFGLILASSCHKEQDNPSNKQVICGLTAALDGNILTLTNESTNIIDTLKITGIISTLNGGSQGIGQYIASDTTILGLIPGQSTEIPTDPFAHYVSIQTDEGCEGTFNLGN